MSKIRILVADDHAVVRAGVKQILNDTADITVAAEVSNAMDAIREVRNRSFDLVLLDISLPDLSGLDLLKRLKILRPELPVLMLSIYPEEQYAVRALKAGSSGYLTKESAPAELTEAIRKVAGGGRYITSSLAERLVEALDDEDQRPPHETLSDREFQVMRKIASGKTLSEIAAELSLSVKTISTYRTRLLEKLNMENNAQITRYALSRNLVD